MIIRNSPHSVFRWLASRIFLLCAGPVLLLTLVSGKSLVTLYEHDALHPVRASLNLLAQHSPLPIAQLTDRLAVQFPLMQWAVTDKQGETLATSKLFHTHTQPELEAGVQFGNTVQEYAPFMPFPQSTVWMKTRLADHKTVTLWFHYEDLFPEIGFAWGIIVIISIALLAMLYYNSMVFSSYVQEHFSKEHALRRKLEQKFVEANRLSSMATMVAGIAHEINTPLAIMTEEAGWVKDLLDDAPQFSGKKEQYNELHTDIARSMTTIANQGERCREITHNLLRMARKGVSDRAPVNVNALAEEVASLSRHRANALGATIIVETQATVPAFAATAHVQQILLNLMTNALDALDTESLGSSAEADSPASNAPLLSPRPQGTAAADYSALRSAKVPETHAAQKRTAGTVKSVRIRTEDHDGTVVITVSDNGRGLSPAEKKRVFEPFFTTKPAGRGTGLGLAISYTLARRNNAHITVDSVKGRGTTCTLVLPTVQVQPSKNDESEVEVTGGIPS